MVSVMVVKKECLMVLMMAVLLDDSWAGMMVVMKVLLMVGMMVYQMVVMMVVMMVVKMVD